MLMQMGANFYAIELDKEGGFTLSSLFSLLLNLPHAFDV